MKIKNKSILKEMKKEIDLLNKVKLSNKINIVDNEKEVQEKEKQIILRKVSKVRVIHNSKVNNIKIKINHFNILVKEVRKEEEKEENLIT